MAAKYGMTEDLIDDILFRLSIGHNLPDIARELGFDIHDFYALFADDKRLRESYGNCIVIGHPIQFKRTLAREVRELQFRIKDIEQHLPTLSEPTSIAQITSYLDSLKDDLAEAKSKLE